MRTFQSVLLFVLCLTLTTLFQNCGGKNSLSVSKTLPSTAGVVTGITPVQKTAQVNGTSLSLDLSDLQTPVNTLEFTITSYGQDLWDMLAPLNYQILSASVSVNQRATVCSQGAGTGPAAADLTNGIFFSDSKHEIFLELAGGSGTDDPDSGHFIPQELQLHVYVRPSSMSAAVFEKSICSTTVSP